MSWKLKEQSVKTEMGELETIIQLGKIFFGFVALVILVLIYSEVAK